MTIKSQNPICGTASRTRRSWAGSKAPSKAEVRAALEFLKPLGAEKRITRSLSRKST
jgi:hypothetical protein